MQHSTLNNRLKLKVPAVHQQQQHHRKRSSSLTMEIQTVGARQAWDTTMSLHQQQQQPSLQART
jgi:hypothetical protein